MELDPSVVSVINRYNHVVLDYGTFISVQMLNSLIVLFFTIFTILMLQRTEQFGYIIIMMTQMLLELGRYIQTIGMIIFLFVVILRLTHLYLKTESINLKGAFLDIFDCYFGNQKIDQYIYPQGQIFALSIGFICKTFFGSLLISMFVLRYHHLWKNIEAIRRMDIIRLKNTQSYDPVFGAITMTYFPINIVLLPFLLPLMFLKSERLNDSILKL
jgi:hypothetical protein